VFRVDAPGPGALLQFVEPMAAMPAYVARRAARHLGLEGDAAAALAASLAAAHGAVMADALSVEARLAGGAVASAAVTLDATARFRHPEWAAHGERPEGTAEEIPFRKVGAVACVPDPAGKVVAVLSGAGLMMTTLDMLTARGARVRCVVDLQGLPLQGAAGMTPIFSLVAAMTPEVTLIGGRFMAPVAHDFAAAVIAANKVSPLTGRVITWVAGNRAEEAQAMFAAAGFARMDDYPAAIGAAAGA
jgi:succinyl-CoA synthetase beta subunit